VARADAYLHAGLHLDPSNRLATVHQRHRKDRTGQTGQRSDSIGRTVLQTVAQKLQSLQYINNNNKIIQIDAGFLPAALPSAQRAGIKVTPRPILRFFAPQGRHVAPMAVKFSVEEGTEGSLLHALRSPRPRQISPPSMQRQGYRTTKTEIFAEI